MVPTTLEQLLQKANQARDKDEHWPAIDLYTELLDKTDPQTTDPDVKEMRLTGLRERGNLLSELGEQVAALAAYEQYYLEAGSNIHAVEALVLIGNRSRGLGRYRRSLTAYQEALELAKALNYTAGRAKAMAGMGGTFILQGRAEEAAAHLNKANALFEQLGDTVGQAQSINQIGIAHGTTGELDKAIAAFKVSIDLSRELGRQVSLVSALNNLGECYQLLFDPEQALVYHQEGLDLAEAAHFRLIEADLCRNMGLDLNCLGRREEGLGYLRRALALAQEVKTLDIQLYSLYALALVEIERDNLEKGYAYAQELQSMATQSRTQGHQANALHALGLYHQRQRNVDTAEEMWQQALFLAHETGKRVLIWQLHAALATIAARPNLANAHYRIAVEVIQQIAEPLEDEALRHTFLTAPPVAAILARGD